MYLRSAEEQYNELVDAIREEYAALFRYDIEQTYGFDALSMIERIGQQARHYKGEYGNMIDRNLKNEQANVACLLKAMLGVEDRNDA